MSEASRIGYHAVMEAVTAAEAGGIGAYDYSLGTASKDWTEQQAIDNIFNSYYPNKAHEILIYWNTGSDLLTYFTYLEKQKHFENVTEKID